MIDQTELYRKAKALYSQVLCRVASTSDSPKNRVVKVSGRWFVRDLIDPSGYVPQVCCKTRREAEEFAQRNERAVLTRLREEMENLQPVRCYYCRTGVGSACNCI